MTACHVSGLALRLSFNVSRLGVSPIDGGLPLRRSGQCAASVEELVLLHSVQADHQISANTVGACSEPTRFLERHRSVGGTAALAGGPFG